MKKRTVIMLFTAIAMLLAGGVAAAVTAAEAGVTVPSSVDGGTDFEIIITLSSAAGDTMSGFSLDMVYDSSKYTVDRMEIGPTLYGSEQSSHSEVVHEIDNTAGELHYCSVLIGESTATLGSETTALTIYCTAANVDDTFDLIFTSNQSDLDLLVSDGSGPNALLQISDPDAQPLAFETPSDTTVTIVGIPPSPTTEVVDGQLIYTAYYLNGNVKQKTVFYGETTASGTYSISWFNEDGNMTSYYQYYEDGVNLKQITTFDPNSPQDNRVVTGTNVYNADGNLTHLYQYYADGTIKLLITYNPDSPQDNRIVTGRNYYNESGSMTSLFNYYDDGTLKLIITFDPTDGSITERNYYNALGQLTNIFGYYDDGTLQEITTYDPNSPEDNRIITARNFYNTSGQLTQINTYYPDGSLQSRTMYNPNTGEVISVENF